MKQNKIVKKLAAALASVTLSALILWFPFPALRALDSAPAADTAQDTELLSQNGQNCAAARRLYCLRQNNERTGKTDELYLTGAEQTDTVTAEEFSAVLEKALCALSLAGALPTDLANIVRENAAAATSWTKTEPNGDTVCYSCTQEAYTDENRQADLIGDRITLTLVNGELVTGLVFHILPDTEFDEEAAANGYADYLGGNALSDWRTPQLNLYATAAAARFSANGQLYLCVAYSDMGGDATVTYSAASITAAEMVNLESRA